MYRITAKGLDDRTRIHFRAIARSSLLLTPAGSGPDLVIESNDCNAIGAVETALRIRNIHFRFDVIQEPRPKLRTV